MLALAEYRASRCPCGCGHAAKDTAGPEIPGKFKARRRICYARAALETAQAAAPNKPENLPGARLWWTEKVR